MQMINFTVRESDDKIRLDLFLTKNQALCSRSRIKKLIEEGLVTVNGLKTKASHQVNVGEKVSITIPDPVRLDMNPESIPLDILFEDDSILVINKPAGITVHPAPGNWHGTLVNALLAHCTNLSGINGILRPGIVHRLDKDTSGLIIVAKDDISHRNLARQLKEREIKRRYLAFVWGSFEKGEGRIEAPIGRHPKDRKRMGVVTKGSREAVTNFRILEVYAFLSLVSLQLETGRTHQIRVHMEHIGHPVFGDPVYGGRTKRIKGILPQYRTLALQLLNMMPRQALHAEYVGFVHPKTVQNMEFHADMPEDMKSLWEALKTG